MPSISPTSFSEVNRLYTASLGDIKKGTLVVTAASEAEGTTLTTHLLALRSAENGVKTLLIDLNMKNKGLTTSLQLKEKKWGLPKRKKTDDLEDLFVAATHNENLFYLPAPTDGDSIEWLKDSKHATDFFKTLAKNFDHVLVDTTPVGLVNRANIDVTTLAQSAGHCVLVALTGITAKEKIQQAYQQLKNANVNLKGLVLNDDKNPSAKETLLKFASSFQTINPGFSNWLRYRISHTEGLD